MSLDYHAANIAARIEEFNQKYSKDKVVIQEVKFEEDELKYNNEFLTADDVFEDVEAKLRTNQFYALSALGGQGSGKSTLGKEFAMRCLAKDYKFVYGLPEDFMTDVDAWIDKILEDPKENNCVMLDDLSYSNDTVGKKQQALFKNVIARIRHKFTEAEEDNKISAKVFIIYVTHRLHATPPMLRNSGTWIFTEMQSADRDDALEVIGKNKQLRENLDQIYTFLSEVIFDGAKHGVIKYKIDDTNYSFRWGSNENAGDGRLMAIYHAGKMQIYNTKLMDNPINFEDYRFKADPIEEEPIKVTKSRKKI